MPELVCEELVFKVPCAQRPLLKACLPPSQSGELLEPPSPPHTDLLDQDLHF